MNKLKLDLDALAVETFETTGTGRGARGTVRAHGYTDQYYDRQQDQLPTQNYSCDCSQNYSCECGVPSNLEDCTWFCASLSTCPTPILTNQNCDTYPDVCL